MALLYLIRPQKSHSVARSLLQEPESGLKVGKIIPLDVKIGDTVLFGKYSGTEVKVDGSDLLVMREEDIMGVIEA